MGAVIILRSTGARPGAIVRIWEKNCQRKLLGRGEDFQRRGTASLQSSTEEARELILQLPLISCGHLPLAGPTGEWEGTAQGSLDPAQPPHAPEQGGEGWRVSVEGRMGVLSYYGMS